MLIIHQAVAPKFYYDPMGISSTWSGNGKYAGMDENIGGPNMKQAP